MVWIVGLLVEKNCHFILGITILICVFSCMWLYCGCGICLQCSQTATKWDSCHTNKTLCWLLRHIMGEGDIQDYKSWSQGVEYWRRSLRRVDHWLTLELILDNHSLFTPSLYVECFPYYYYVCSYFKDVALRQ